MNKTYKTVYNAVSGTWVAVSELAKSQGKNTTRAAAALVLLAVAPAWGAQNTGTTTSGGTVVPAGTDYKTCYYDDNSKNVVCGDATTTAADVVDSKPGKSVAIGMSSTAAGESNVALGSSASASSTSGLAIGSNSKAHHNQTVAIGERASALGEADIAIGKAAGENATSTGRNIAVGEGAVKDATAANNVIGIGTGAAQKISGSHVIAIGTEANQGVTGVNQVVAIGYKSSAVTSQSVAVGTAASAKNIGALALGNSSNAVTESSVAVGRFSQASGANSIAVGGGRSADKSARAGGTYSIAVGAGTEATHAQSIAMGLSAGAKGVGTVAVGDTAQATKTYAIAIGNKAEASGEKSVVIGSNETATNIAKATGRQSVAIGWTAQATGFTQAVAIGPDAQALGGQSTSIGNNTRAKGNSSIAIGSDDWDLAKAQVDADYQRLTGTAMSAGYQSTEAAEAAIAVGVKAQATGALSTAFGPGARATEVGATAVGVGAEADKEKAVAIGAGSRTSTVATPVTSATVNGVTYSGFAGATKITDGSQVSIGTKDYERQIKHVAPGEISATSTDAINGSQLYHVAAQAANPLKFDGDSGTTVERPLGTTLNVKGGATGTLTDNNIGVVADKASNTLRVKLAQNVDLGSSGSLKTGDTTVNNSGLTIANGPSVTNTGIDAGNKQITNVASGGNIDSNAANIGDVKRITNQLSTNIQAAKTEVVAGDNIQVTHSFGNNNQSIYTVKTVADPTFTSVTTGGNKLDGTAINVNGNTVTHVNDAINKTAAQAFSPLTFTGNKNSDTGNDGSQQKLGSSLHIGGGLANTAAASNSNIRTEVTDGKVDIQFADAPTFAGTVTAPTFKADSNTLDNTPMTVNGNTVTNVNNAINQTAAQAFNPLKFDGDSGTTVERKLGTTLNVKGGATGTLTDNNIGVVADNASNTLRLKLAQNVDLGNAGSLKTGNTTVNNNGLTINNGPSVTNNGIDAGNKQISNLADGNNPTDAVNVRQLQAAVAAGSNAAGQQLIQQVNNHVNNLNQRIDKLEDNSNAGIAGGIAQSSIPQVTRAGASGIGVGTGYYGGQSAIAVGVSSISDGGNWIMKGSFSINSQGRTGVGAGALYQW
ncbi:hypothetical protein A7P85_06910 [Eikenella corrodens]|uniref:Adhesin n=1 Tax=Eikenella corrodens TaxID=539 RepID=A0A1A9RDE2_EIKCO|nr:YadA-like family protein [Eikenella corrodens]OAM16137.1 hypothetical protein A7P85_06910 [Eikenella corrodens]OAM23369.1 hypothetical protein A7P92_07245 [Eikenella corrodens]